MARKKQTKPPPPPPPAFVTQAEFARLHEVTRKSVTKWKSKGLVVVNEVGLVDVAKSNALLGQRPPSYRGGVARGVTSAGPHKGNKGIARVAAKPKGNKATPARIKNEKPGNGDTESAAAPPTAPEDPSPELGWTTSDANRVKENYLALQRKQEYEVAQGRLVEVSVVRAVVEKAYSVVRERLLTMPGKLADRLVDKDRAAIDDMLRAEITEALNELSQPASYARAGSALEPAPGSGADLPAAADPGPGGVV